MFLLWAGAAISIAEIYTGGIIAPLGLKKGLAAIVIGHIIGTLFLAFGGYISFKDNKNAMGKVRDSLGPAGTKVVAFLNVLQLLGWSAIMIIQGGRALNAATGLSYNISLLVTAIAVFIWAYSFKNYTSKVNDVSVIVLIILCIMMIFKVDLSKQVTFQNSINFVTAIEISIAMPVSWLPLIGDYTKDGESKKGVFLSSFFGYIIGSVLMYALGLIISVYTGKDIIEFIAGSSVGFIVCLVVLLSTVTTTFLDIFSAVESSKQIITIKKDNIFITIYCIIAAVLAYFFPMENYQNFLTMIGSVFVPVYTVVFASYFLKERNGDGVLNIPGIIIAACGTVLYNYFTKLEIGIPTVLVFAIVFISYTLIKKILKGGNVK